MGTSRRRPGDPATREWCKPEGHGAAELAPEQPGRRLDDEQSRPEPDWAPDTVPERTLPGRLLLASQRRRGGRRTAVRTVAQLPPRVVPRECSRPWWAGIFISGGPPGASGATSRVVPRARLSSLGGGSLCY